MALAPAEINIKNHIIRYPLLFQSRMDVLKHVLIRDPESKWMPDGTIRSNHISVDDTIDGKINLSDFPISEFTSERSISNSIIVAKLKIIEQNFDFVVSNKMDFENPIIKDDLTSLNEYSLIFNLPENIEDSWKNAVRQLAFEISIFLKNECCKNNCDGADVEHWLYPFYFEQYKKIQDIQKKFMPTISPEVAEKLKKLVKLLQ